MTRQVMVDAEALENLIAGWDEGLWGPQTADAGIPDLICGIVAQLRALTKPPAEPERALVTELEILRRGWERDAIVIYAQETVRETDGSTTWLDNECRIEHDTLRRCIADLAALTQPTPESHKVPQAEEN